MAIEPKTGLTVWTAGILQPDLIFNDLLFWTAAWAQAVVLSFEDDPPPTPADGDMHIVGIGTGAFSGHDNELAYWMGGEAQVWIFYPPGDGYEVRNLADSNRYLFTDGSAGSWDVISGGGSSSASIGVRYTSDLGSTADSDPGPGLLKWNNATQGSATVLYLDDATLDGASMTGLWAAMDLGGFAYLQDATDQDIWQIWEIGTITDATGYVKLAVTLLAKGVDFADDSVMLVTLQQGPGTGGTFTGGALSSALDEAKGSNIASASTTNIGAATGNLVHITGTTTITAFDTVQAGTRRILVFDGVLILTHNGTSLILPTGANITTAAGDTAVFVSEGSGNWRCAVYQRKDGTALASSGGGGLTNWTEGVNSSSPNIGTPVVYFQTSNAATNVDAAILKKGSGAIIAAIPDSTATGGNKRSSNAVDLQMVRTTASQVAAGDSSALIAGRNNTIGAGSSYSGILAGQSNNITGSNSVAGGESNTVSGTHCVAFGKSNTANNNYGAVFGNICTAGLGSIAAGEVASASGSNAVAFGSSVTADATYSMATGQYAHTRGVIGSRSNSAGRINGVAVDCQWRDFVFGAGTTNATPKAATANFSAASTNNQVILPNNSAMLVRADVIARQNATGETKSWETRTTVKRGANAAATAIVGSAVVTVCDADAGASAWTLGVTADTTNGGLTYTVTGEAAKTITWVVVPRGPEAVG